MNNNMEKFKTLIYAQICFALAALAGIGVYLRLTSDDGGLWTDPMNLGLILLAAFMLLMEMRFVLIWVKEQKARSKT